MIILVILGMAMVATAFLYPRLTLANTSNDVEESRDLYQAVLYIRVDNYYVLSSVSVLTDRSSEPGFSIKFGDSVQSLGQELYSLYLKVKIQVEVNGVTGESPVYTITDSRWQAKAVVTGLEPGSYTANIKLYLLGNDGEWHLKSTMTETIKVG